MILGCQYFIAKGIVLDFANFSYQCDSLSVKVTTTKAVTIPPNAEVTVLAKVPKKLMIGQQGVCIVHQTLMDRNLLLAKSLCSVSHNSREDCKCGK